MTIANRNVAKYIIPPDSTESEVEFFDIPSVGDDYFRKLPDDPVVQAENFVKSYRQNPLKFIKYELGIPIDAWRNDVPPKGKIITRAQLPLWSKQREIIQSLIKHKKVAVKSGHAIGKSFIAAVSALTLHYAWRAIGITTAPTFRQVRRVLWGEIHSIYNNSPRKLGGNLFQTSLESGDKWFIEGFSTRDPSSAFAGFHEENIFIIIDEAGGVPQEVYDTMEGILTSENSFVLLIGNPLDSASAFADSFKPDSPYYKITMSCYDSPNVRNQRNIYPKLVTYDWPERMKKKWGVDSNLFRVRVLGEFPAEGRDTLIPIKYLELATDTLKTYFEAVGNSKEESLISLGADIARLGEDSTEVGARWRNKLGLERFEILGSYAKQRTDETTDRIVEWYHTLVRPGERPVINIDDIGLGGGVVDNLLKAEYPVNPINVGETPDTYIEDDEKFLNKRAQYYWNLREMFVQERVGIDDDMLAHELSKIGLDFGGSGKEKIKIEPKDKTRKKLQGKSPDKADCMMLAFAEEDELSSQRWIF